MPYNWTEWKAFLEANPNAEKLVADEKYAMFWHALDNPKRNSDEYHAALWSWRQRQMGLELAD